MREIGEHDFDRCVCGQPRWRHYKNLCPGKRGEFLAVGDPRRLQNILRNASGMTGKDIQARLDELDFKDLT